MNQEHRLNSFHLCCLGRILGISWKDRVPNTQVLQYTTTPSMYSLLAQAMLAGSCQVHGFRMHTQGPTVQPAGNWHQIQGMPTNALQWCVQKRPQTLWHCERGNYEIWRAGDRMHERGKSMSPWISGGGILPVCVWPLQQSLLIKDWLLSHTRSCSQHHLSRAHGVFKCDVYWTYRRVRVQHSHSDIEMTIINWNKTRIESFPTTSWNAM